MLEAFIGILTKCLVETQLHEILEAITAAYELGCCPLCGCADIPVDKDGSELEEEDVSRASDYREVHDDDCPVTLIEQSFSKEVSPAK